MLIFRNMREMTKDEIKVFLREGRKIGCAVQTKEERQELLEALSRSKETGFPQFVLVYEKRCADGLSFHLRRGRAYLDYPQCRRKDIRAGKGNAGVWP